MLLSEWVGVLQVNSPLLKKASCMDGPSDGLRVTTGFATGKDCLIVDVQVEGLQP